MSQTGRIEELLLINKDDPDYNKKHELIKTIEDLTLERFMALTGVGTNDADKWGYIITEVSIKRYNRLRNEGMSSYSQEGESITFKDDDFAEFEKEINQLSDPKNKPSIIKFIDAYNR